MRKSRRDIGGRPAAVAAAGVLTAHIRRIAEAGRLRVGEERAAQLVHAAGPGTALSLIALPQDRRDLALSDLALSDLAREAVITAITAGTAPPGPPGPVAAAVALRAQLPQTPVLTAHERGLLPEWLDRIASS